MIQACGTAHKLKPQKPHLLCLLSYALLLAEYVLFLLTIFIECFFSIRCIVPNYDKRLLKHKSQKHHQNSKTHKTSTVIRRQEMKQTYTWLRLTHGRQKVQTPVRRKCSNRQCRNIEASSFRSNEVHFHPTL